MHLQAVSEHWASQQQKGLQKGERVWVCGTPFGTMSPQHFLNCLCSGTVANCVRGEVRAASKLPSDDVEVRVLCLECWLFPTF